MRTGYVTQWFPPEPGTVVPESIARGLAEQGHTVDVLTGFPNYPTGKVMPGYRIRPYQREVLTPAITVHRAPLFPSHSSAAVPRMANYASFAAGASAVARAKVARPDVWLIYSSPATAAVPALRLLRRTQAPIFLLIQDLWPDSVTDSGFVGGLPGRVVTDVLDRFCRLTYRRASGIGIISPGMRAVLVARGVPDAIIHDTPNGIDDSHLLPHATPSAAARAAFGLADGRLFMYAGNLGELQGLDALIRAFAARPDAQLVLVGDGVARTRLVALAHDLGASNVRFLGQVSLAQVGELIAQSDVQIVSLHDTPLLRVTMPSKVQTSLAAGRAVLAHAAGDAASIVTDNRVGWSAAPGDPEAVLAALDLALATSDAELEAMGRAARALFEERFSRDSGARRLSDALEATVAHAAHA